MGDSSGSCGQGGSGAGATPWPVAAGPLRYGANPPSKSRSAAPGGTGRRSPQPLDGVLIQKHRRPNSSRLGSFLCFVGLRPAAAIAAGGLQACLELGQQCEAVPTGMWRSPT